MTSKVVVQVMTDCITVFASIVVPCAEYCSPRHPHDCFLPLVTASCKTIIMNLAMNRSLWVDVCKRLVANFLRRASMAWPSSVRSWTVYFAVVSESCTSTLPPLSSSHISPRIIDNKSVRLLPCPVGQESKYPAYPLVRETSL